MGQEIRLKVFYVLCVPVFIWVNVQLFVWLAPILQPLADTAYSIPAKLVEEMFLLLLLVTFIAAIGNMFFLKFVDLESMRWFLILMVSDSSILMVTMVATIGLGNMQLLSLRDAVGLLNIYLFMPLYGLKELLLLLYFKKRAVKVKY